MKRWKDLPLEEKLEIEIDELPLSKSVIKTLKTKGIYTLGGLVEKYRNTVVKPLTHAERVHYETTRLGLAMDVFTLDNPDVYTRDIPRYEFAHNTSRHDAKNEMRRNGVSYKCIETLFKRIKRKTREHRKTHSEIMRYSGRAGFSNGPKYY